ncbi:MAG: GntR family transcriptional regulator [Propionibacteriaceae bacterium]|jgi:GntR family transcriptional regulator|nr:GntR family transcriptional regulator [Propionibacteriaceae bacterium]
MPQQTKYAAVRDRLAGRIEKLQPGDQLPPEGELCKEYKVSRITLRRAVEDLIHEGLLVRQQGRGTFVTQPTDAEPAKAAYTNGVRGFYRQQLAAGNQVATSVLANEIANDGKIATLLGLGPGADLIRLARLRYVNGELHHLSAMWLDAARFPRVLVHDFSSGSLFEFLETTYSLALVRDDLLVRLSKASDEASAALGVDFGETLLAMDSTVFGTEGPLVFGTTYFAPDAAEIAISLQDPSERPSAAPDEMKYLLTGYGIIYGSEVSSIG